MTNASVGRNLRLALLIAAWLVLSCARVFAGNSARMLLLNSDASVERYKIPQTEFQKMITVPLKSVNLSEKKWSLAAVEELFYDEDPDLVYCIGTKAYLLAQKYAGDTPIVFSSIINWLRFPHTDATYGVSNELHAGMEMMLFRYVFPNVRRIGVLYSRKYTEEWFRQAQSDAQEMGIALIGRKVSAKKEVAAELQTLLADVDAFWLVSDPTLMTDKQELFDILKRCDRREIPVFSYHEAFAGLGAMLTVSVDNPTIGRQAAGIALAVLAGETFEEKVQFPAGSYIVLNLNKVRDYGVDYNEEALSSINDIIE